MKRLIINFLFLSAILVLTATSGCKKDKDADKQNFIKYDNKQYDLSQGFIEYYGEIGITKDCYNFDILLFSSGLSYNTESEYFTGKGNFVTLELFSSSPSEIVPGTYTYDPQGLGEALTFYNSQFALNFDTSSGSGLEGGVTGSVEIEKSGNYYEITFKCTAFDGKELTGYCKGSFEVFDYSEKD